MWIGSPIVGLGIGDGSHILVTVGVMGGRAQLGYALTGRTT
jgi:hypothetical protein